jgi:hypothetical protein
MVEAEPSQQQYRKYLGDGFRHRGIVLQKCGRPAEAVSAFREAISILEGLTNPSPGDLYATACTQSLLSGAAVEAGAGQSAADARAESDKAMESLRRAIAAGWNRAAHMQIDTDLDSLRSRPDFQMLILDLAMPADPFGGG